MITTSNITDRVLKAMQNGAKLTLHYCYHGYDGYSTLESVTLDKGDQSLTLSHWIDRPGGTPPFCEDGPRVKLINGYNWEEFVKHPDIRQGYCYNGECAIRWRRTFVRVNQPVPRWISEQWGMDDDGNLMPPDFAALSESEHRNG